MTTTTRTTTLLIGTDDGLVRVGDTTTRTPGHSVRGLAHDPGTGHVFAAFGMRGAGLLRSVDGGTTWSPVAGWPGDRQAWAIAAPGDGRLLVGSQPADLWQGRVDAPTWETNASLLHLPERAEWSFIHAPFEAHLLALSRDPRDPTRWAAAVEVGGIVVSADDAHTWRQVSPVWDAHVVLHTLTGTTVAATGGGLRVTSDLVEWDRVGPGGYATGLTRDVQGDLFSVVKGARGGPLWRSPDGGRSWKRVEVARQLPHPGYGVHALAADPSEAGVVYYGADDSAWRVGPDGVSLLAQGLPTVRRLLAL